MSQLEIELEYAKTQLAKSEQEKKDAEKLCNSWKEMRTETRRMNARSAAKASQNRKTKQLGF